MSLPINACRSKTKIKRRWRLPLLVIGLALLVSFPLQSAQAAPTKQLNPLLPMLQSLFQEAGPALPDLMGMNGPRTYLVLVQNNHELRPTGGFISAVGKVTLTSGELSSVDFVDSYSFFRENLQYPPAPQPMQQYMGIQLLVLRDANWSPDLPTTARLIQGFYAQQTGESISGVVTVDLQAAELIVDALGPLELSGSDQPLTGSNFVEQILQMWENPVGTDLRTTSSGFNAWWGQRKNFMSLLVEAARQKMGSGQLNYAKLFLNVQAALSRRAIQVWVDEPNLARRFAELGWDGGIHLKAGSDFLALVDTNMGYNKVDAVLQRTLSYSVAWPDGPSAPAVATAVITYTHPIKLANYSCTNTPGYGESYNFLVERCYYDYVRLYVPSGSHLLGIEGVDENSVVTQRSENHTQYFGGYFVLPVGQQQTVTFHYRLPPQLTPQNYQLTLQRQAGSNALPITVSVDGKRVATTLNDAQFHWPAP